MDPCGRRGLLAVEVDRGERPKRTVLGTGLALPAAAGLEDVLGMGRRKAGVPGHDASRRWQAEVFLDQQPPELAAERLGVGDQTGTLTMVTVVASSTHSAVTWAIAPSSERSTDRVR